MKKNEYQNRLCHNTNCKTPRIRKNSYFVCDSCKYMEYCSQKCRDTHWKNHHNRECNALKNTNFIEAILLNAKCPQLEKWGIHKHPKITNERIKQGRSELIRHINKLLKEETVLSCKCNKAVGKNVKSATPSIMPHNIPCMNKTSFYVYIRCKDFKCEQRKNPMELFILYPLSSSHRVFVIIPHQKERPKSLEFMNFNSENFSNTPEGYDMVRVEMNRADQCSQCTEVEIKFKLMAVKNSDNSESNDNSNIRYIFNDVEDKWEEESLTDPQ